MGTKNILVWLPSPMGDAILCTPALRALRRHLEDAAIFFLANRVVRQVLAPTTLCDKWLDWKRDGLLITASKLKQYNFVQAILFKNSFGSALTTFLARIPCRIGYSRQGRGLFLSEKLHAPKTSAMKFTPLSMIDYYLALACWLGCDIDDRNLELTESEEDKKSLAEKLPDVLNATGPVVVLVPGGAFGPSKCWLPERFSQTADFLIEKHNATVVVSVSPNEAEKKIAEQICRTTSNKLINLAGKNLSLPELKSLFAASELVITNDTGPRHIAIAMKRKVITLFGPNHPAWTDTGYEKEIKIVGNAPCSPCTKHVCKEKKHFCMEDISTEQVCAAAEKLLES